MTLEEAKKVAEVCQEADGNCPSCVDALTKLLNETFPEFVWEVYEEDWNTRIRVTNAASSEGIETDE